MYTFHLARELARSHHVTLFFTDFSPAARRPRVRKGHYQGIPFYEVRSDRAQSGLESTYLNPEMEEVVQNIARRESPDVVHIQHLMYHSLAYPVILKREHIPVVFTLHDYHLLCPAPEGVKRIRNDLSPCGGPRTPDCLHCISADNGSSPFDFSITVQSLARRVPIDVAPFLSRIRKYLPLGFLARLDRLSRPRRHPWMRDLSPETVSRRQEYLHSSLIPSVDLFSAPSRFMLEKHIENGFPSDRVRQVNYGIPLALLRGLSPPRKKRMQFGYIGNLIPSKGVHVLIEAFRKTAIPGARLLIFGDPAVSPEYGRELKRKSRGIPVAFRGPFPPERIADVYRNIDCLVVPSLWEENSPFVIHEAQAAGIPVVASRIGGIPELVRDGENGFLFEPGNPADLNEKTREALHPETLASLRQKAMKVKSIEEHAREVENVYREVQ